MIKLDEAEVWAFNLLNSSVTNAEAELNRTVAARSAYVKLLESKYSAVFNPLTGEFTAKESVKSE